MSAAQRASACRSLRCGPVDMAVVVAILVSLAMVGGCSGGDDGAMTAGVTATGVTATATAPEDGDDDVSDDDGPSATDVWSRSVVTPATVAADHVGDPSAFVETSAAFKARVASAGLAGGVLRVVRDGQVIHETAVGGYTGSTPLPMASATKWFTSAVVMSLVDDGLLDLDEPISTYMAAAREPGVVTAATTVRHLMTHTSGVRDVPCIRNSWGSPQDCARTLLRTPLEFPSGEGLAYGNGPWHLLGRLVVEVTGVEFEDLFRQRVATPLGLKASTWGGGPNPATGGGLVTTVDDYSRFLEMILGAGTTRDGVEVLSRGAVAEMVTNQVAQFTWRDMSAVITGINGYGLGMWLDEIDDDGRTVIISGNASLGYYPWIDFSTGTYGVLAVNDPRGPEKSVPASQKVAYMAIEATKRA